MAGEYDLARKMASLLAHVQPIGQEIGDEFFVRKIHDPEICDDNKETLVAASNLLYEALKKLTKQPIDVSTLSHRISFQLALYKKIDFVRVDCDLREIPLQQLLQAIQEIQTERATQQRQ